MLIEPSNFIEKEIPRFTPGTYRYVDYWSEQKRRCIEGYWVGGKFMPGRLYFYVNFWKILLNKDEYSKNKVIARPFLRDIEWDIAYALTVCRGFSGFIGDKPNEIIPLNDGLEFLRNTTKSLGRPVFKNPAKDFMLMGSRGFGKSYMVAGMIVGHEWCFDGTQVYYKKTDPRYDNPRATILVGASVSKYSNEILDKVRLGLTHLPGAVEYNDRKFPSPFSKQYRGSWKEGKDVEQIYKVKNDGGWEEKGTGTVIKHRTFHSDPFAGNGIRSSMAVIEECGLFPNLITTQGSLRSTQTDDNNRKFGTTVYLGTGGDMEGSGTIDSEKMFNNPHDYEILPFPDIYEHSGEIGYFVPVTKKYNICRDKYGNTIENEANILYEKEKEIEKNKSKEAYERWKINNPIKPSEMFTNANQNIFPSDLLVDWEGRVKSSKTLRSFGTPGRFKKVGSEVIFELTDDPPITEYPVPSDHPNKNGCIVMYFDRQRIEGNRVPDNTYFINVDPYAMNKEQIKLGEKDSYGCAMVFIRQSSLVDPSNTIAAEYFGRPENMDDFNEQVFLMSQYYNAKINFEMDRGNVFEYAKRTKQLSRLIKGWSIIPKKIETFAIDTYGYSMSNQFVKQQAEWYGADWLKQKRGVDENGDVIYNLHSIYSPGLLKELRLYNKDGNFDRVMCFIGGVSFFSRINQIEETQRSIDQAYAYFDQNLF